MSTHRTSLALWISLVVAGCTTADSGHEANAPQAPETGGSGGMQSTGGIGGNAGSTPIVVPIVDSGAGDASADAGARQDAETDAATDASATPDAEYSEDPGDEGDGDLEISGPYTRDPDLTDRGNPEGREFNFTIALDDSSIFSGDDATLDPGKPVRAERNIWVYVPDAYVDGTEAPILVMHDGSSQLDLVRFALDNLTVSTDADRSLPAFIAISVENGGDDSKGSERGLEYDTMSDRFARFIEEEVLPAALADSDIQAAYPNIAFTSNPWGKGSMGCSSGGAAALTMGWFRPDLFRRVVTYSGTFVDQQDDDAPEEAMYPLGAWEYHSGLKLIENSAAKPLRIFIHASENDLGATASEADHHNWVLANQRTAAALSAKGYHYRSVYSLGTGHCDRGVFEKTLADTLVWMWRGYH